MFGHPFARAAACVALAASLSTIAAAAITAAAAATTPARISVLPVPGDRYAPPGTGITFHGATLAGLRGLRVVGSVSGLHQGTLKAWPGDVVTFTPASPFAGGETVTVSAPGLDVTGVPGAPYEFGTARPAPPAAAAAELRAAAADDGGTAAPAADRAGSYSPPACQTAVYHSAPTLDAGQMCMNLGVATTGTEPGTYLFATPGDRGAGIFSDDGSLVWWQPAPPGQGALDETVVQYGGNPYIALWTGIATTFGKGVVTLYNEHYQVAGVITATSGFAPDEVDLHEFRITPQGDALIGIYEPVDIQYGGATQTVLQYVVEEVSLEQTAGGIRSGALLFEWDSLTDVPVSESQVPNAPGTAWDYFHGNAITQDSDGNLVVSARNTWGLYKLDATPGTSGYGHVTWEVGAMGDAQLSPTSWCYQHDVTALGGDTYSLFDDGGVGPGCEPPLTQHPARGLIFTVNPATTPPTITLDEQYAHDPSIYVGYTGSTELLADGNVLVDWANVPEITEYSSTGTVLMDLSMSGGSYRGLRFAWNGQPLTQPSVATSVSGGTTTLWASWNGATDVAAWQVLGGDDPTHLVPVGPPVARTGFETQMSLPSSDGVVAVEALSSSGAVLGTSASAYSAGYVVATSSGAVAGAGDARDVASPALPGISSPVVAIAEPSRTGGYWYASSAGGVYSFGGVHFYGSLAGEHLNKPIVGISPTPAGNGYWLVAADGGIFSFGGARFHGSAGDIRLNKPIVGMAPTPDGGGYWLVASDGGVFTYGDARFHGSGGGSTLPSPVVSMSATADGGGYWLFLANGTVLAYGDAHDYGSAGHITGSVVGNATTLDRGGYWLITSTGEVIGFGDAPDYGTPHVSGQFVGIADA